MTTRIGPVRNVRRAPRWVWPCWLITASASFAGGHNAGNWTMLLWLPGFIASFAFALWLEDRLWTPVAHAKPAKKLLFSVAAVVAGAIANVVVGFVVQDVLLVFGFDAGLFACAQLFVFWFVSAALGGVPVVVTSALTGRLLGGFRRRVQAAVIALVGASIALSLFAAVSGISLVEALKHHEPHLLIGKDTVAGIDISPERFATDWVPIIDSPVIIVLVAFLLGAFYALPAILSATRKIADDAVERIGPLAIGFDKLAGGDRMIEVEVGGADELVHIITRFNAMVVALGLAERMERAFGQYVSEQVLERIRAQHGDAMLPAQTREASVFFADIRGFTSMSEKLEPAQVVALLNRYFERAVAVINAHHGYLNKFIGDAVVVVFNGPIDQPDHAARATSCAIALQQTIAEMNAAHAFPEIGELKVGIGVATGPMVCGNVGGSSQMEYTVIGDTVNLSARLTSKAGPGEVWVSEATSRALPPPLATTTTALEPISVKGKEQPVRPFRAWPQ